MLLEGEKPNEGRVEFLRSDSTTWEPICEHGLGHEEASVICRQLGYPGVNHIIPHWPLESSVDLAEYRLYCTGDNDYIGCYPLPSAAFEEIQTQCGCGLQNSDDLTIINCETFCDRANGGFAGIYRGNLCLCGSSSSPISQSERVDDRLCSYPCTGRTIEKCGGYSHVALFKRLGTADSEVSGSTAPPRELVTTNGQSTFSSGAINLSGNCTCTPQTGSWASEGVQIFLIAFVIALILYGVAISLFHLHFRRTNVSPVTEEGGPDPYMELQPRPGMPDDGKTYQEITVTPTASAKGPRERRPPQADLIYENQTVAKYANKILREDGNDYTENPSIKDV
ncbi:uncharacterized protein LOC129280700 [Lytechinus pictus]|uniref:uncharacterized protein LOC129280700 n=1 Tax=Lytechinus pictus TaxID=7653 RepID=UPI0030B9DD31